MRILGPVVACFCLMLNLAGIAWAEERRFDLALPDGLTATGLPTYLLPRFALKHGIRVTVVAPGQSQSAEILAGPGRDAAAVFSGGDVTYFLRHDSANPHAARFAEWLTSEIGHRTLAAFPGEPAFTGDIAEAETAAEIVLVGSAAQGEAASLLHCGRCHVVAESNRMNGIGSTPSFYVLRALADWYERFETFFVRKPHPSFTVIPEVTEPFSSQRPPPIFPLYLSIDELDDILAYVSGLEPADLGAPLQHQ